MAVQFAELLPDTPYRVTAGENDDFSPGDLFWVDSRDGSLVFCDQNAGWLEKDEVPPTLFNGLTIEVSEDYEIQTNARIGGYSALRKRAS